MTVNQRVEADLEWCHDAVQGVSRTFALTVDVLEDPLSSHICLGYLLCRIADTVEDADHIPPETQVEVLRTYHAALDSTTDVTMQEFRVAVDPWLPAPGDRNDDWAVVAAAPTVWATFTTQPESVRTAILGPVREMVDGMAMFVERHAATGGLRIDDRSELEEYCYYAAGTVGILITNLLTRGDVAPERARTLYDTAEEFGLLLQLINVSKDAYDDYTAENNVYLPATWFAEEGIEQEAVVDPTVRESAANVVHRAATHATTFLDGAQAYLETMPLVHGNKTAAWSVPYLLGVGTLRELRERPADTLTATGVKVSRQEVFAVLDVAQRTDQDSLGALRERIAQKPYHHAVK